MMRRAFTLVELLVVVALMGMMATLAVGNYSSIVRGMNDRAALDAAKSIAEAARQRANLDRRKTYLYLFNEVTKIDSDMSAGSVCGVMIAVRPTGRITQVPEAGLFCDEFGDLNQTYKALEEDDSDEQSESEQKQSASTIRLYNILSKDYASVHEGVYSFDITGRDLEAGDDKQVSWTVYGFKKESGDADFAVGDLYGQEFAVTRLPPNYTFSQSVSMSGTSDLGQKKVQVIEINPTDSDVPSLRVYVRRPNGSFESIGDIRDAKDGKK